MFSFNCLSYVNLNLGTHEVHMCVANNCSTGGRVNISCNFTDGSKAKGYLSILCPQNISVDELFVVANRNDRSSPELNVSVPWVRPNNYTVVVFDLQNDGLPPVLSGDINYAAEREENVNVTDSGGGT